MSGRLVALVLAILWLPAPALGRVGVVAPFGGLGVPATEAGKVQRWLEAALAAMPGHRWLSPARLAKLLRSSPRLAGCEAQPRCLGGLLRQLGADLTIVGEVGSLGGGFMVYLQLVDSGGRSQRSVNGVLDPAGGGLREAVRGLVYQLLQPERYTGTLKVEVDVANAWIYLDGKRVARSPAKAIASVSVGTHALRVTHEAYRDFVRFVGVGFGETVDVPVKLTAYAVRSGQMKLVREADRTLTDRQLPWYRRWWALTAFGAVVLAGSATVAALLLQRSAPHDAELPVRP